jgi:hypothetical protein
MRHDQSHKLHDSALGTWLCALGVAVAIALPLVASKILVLTTPRDELSCVLLVVAVFAIAFDRK